MDAKVEAVPVPLCKLGEGPHWNAAKQELYYVDLLGQAVHRYVPSTGEHAQVNVRRNEDRVTLVVPVEDEPNKFVVAVGRTLELMEWDGKSTEPTSLTTLFSVESDILTNRFNDGKCDANGRLWAGTMNDADHTKYEANFYRVCNKIESQHKDIGISNGIAWNKDNTLMYYIDTTPRTVDVFDFDLAKGTISNRRIIYDFNAVGERGDPDGMEIDSDGNLWVACWAGYQIFQLNPTTGEKMRTIEFPTKQITSIAWGGPDLDVMYVTSAADRLTDEERAEQPLAGALFQVTGLGVKGMRPGINFRAAHAKKSCLSCLCPCCCKN